MKKSVIIFAMLSAAIAFISCEENNLIKSRTEAVMDSIDVDTIDTSRTDTASIPKDTVGTHAIYISLDNATFTLTPLLVDSANLGQIGLKLNIESDQSYKCLNSQLWYRDYSGFNQEDGVWKIKDGRLTIEFVEQPGAKYCEEGEQKVTGSAYVLYPINEGKNNLEVVMNSITYKGSITRTGDIFKIDWPDTSAIKFSTHSLTK
ncbi:hypothetical protein [Dyadobacter sp. NIV53]|uniref:hypothetical protein n=1 Tax=Dyadobacter sp. NIV53 TaxID=2861765 RepID=UPI001C88A2C4|nr:hypothetical protein [Dyadobacter sp. NIV53]